MRDIPESDTSIVADHNGAHPIGLNCANPRGLVSFGGQRGPHAGGIGGVLSALGQPLCGRYPYHGGTVDRRRADLGGPPVHRPCQCLGASPGLGRPADESTQGRASRDHLRSGSADHPPGLAHAEQLAEARTRYVELSCSGARTTGAPGAIRSSVMPSGANPAISSKHRTAPCSTRRPFRTGPTGSRTRRCPGATSTTKIS